MQPATPERRDQESPGATQAQGVEAAEQTSAGRRSLPLETEHLRSILGHTPPTEAPLLDHLATAEQTLDRPSPELPVIGPAILLKAPSPPREEELKATAEPSTSATRVNPMATPSVAL